MTQKVTVRQFAKDMGISYQVARLRFLRGEVTGSQFEKNSSIFIDKTEENGYTKKQLAK